MNKENKTPKDENGLAHGLWEEYYSNEETLLFKGYYYHGRMHGYCENYFLNGRVIYKGSYIHDQKYGYWNRYHDGIFFKTFYFYNGEKMYITLKNKIIL